MFREHEYVKNIREQSRLQRQIHHDEQRHFTIRIFLEHECCSSINISEHERSRVVVRNYDIQRVVEILPLCIPIASKTAMILKGSRSFFEGSIRSSKDSIAIGGYFAVRPEIDRGCTTRHLVCV